MKTTKGRKKASAGEEAKLGALERLHRQLHTSVIPDTLQCREEELGGMVELVAEALATGGSQSLYVSGVPGTGKTATVHKAVQQLREDPDLPDFHFVALNGMNLAEPSEFYPRLYAHLNPDAGRISAAKALAWLNHLFLDGVAGRRPVVLLVDELDLLCTRRQNVLYQIFEWGSKERARLVVLAVANTLDLPERLLPHRVSSRLGMARQCFQPYDFQQVSEILSARLGSASGAVEAEAVELISRKVSRVSGDLRKALHIAREAVSEAVAAGEERLSMGRVQSVLRRMRETEWMEWVRGVSGASRLLLEAAVSEYERTGHEEVSLGALMGAYRDHATLRGEGALGREELLRLVASLAEARLVVLLPAVSVWNRFLRLNLPIQDINFALAQHRKV